MLAAAASRSSVIMGVNSGVSGEMGASGEAAAGPPVPRQRGAGRGRLVFERGVVAGVTLAWSALVLGSLIGELALPHQDFVVLAYPAALIAALIFTEGAARRPELRLAAAWSTILAAAYWITPDAMTSPVTAGGFLAVLVAAVVCWRFPAAAIVALFAGTAIQASVVAFTGYDLIRVADLVLAGFWIGLFIRLASRHRDYTYSLWPAVIGCLGYIGLTLIAALVADVPQIGFLSFRASAWFMLAFVLVAYAGFSTETHRKIVRGVVAVTALVAGYAVLRWIIGPAADEARRGYAAGAGINIVDGHLRTFGSFLTGHQLAFWTAFTAPFCLAIAIGARGRLRLLAGAATALCVFAILASEARGPLVGLVVGVVLVLALSQASIGMRRTRRAVTALAVALVLGCGGVAFALTASDPAARSRYERILDPSSDVPYAIRVAKWEDAFDDIERHPFGQGLGSAGDINQRSGRYLSIASVNLDNSYLKIAYEQGLAVMAYFVVALLLLLASLAVGGVRARSADTAAPAIGAAGALASTLVSFYSGLYIEGLSVLGAWLIVGIGMSRLVSFPAAGPAAAEADPARAAAPSPSIQPA